jgi:hypothetical protein
MGSFIIFGLKQKEWSWGWSVETDRGLFSHDTPILTLFTDSVFAVAA